MAETLDNTTFAREDILTEIESHLKSPDRLIALRAEHLLDVFTGFSQYHQILIAELLQSHPYLGLDTVIHMEIEDIEILLRSNQQCIANRVFPNCL